MATIYLLGCDIYCLMPYYAIMLDRTLFKSLIGRYYRATEVSREMDAQVSFRDARAAVGAHAQSHVSQRNQSSEDSKWQEL